MTASQPLGPLLRETKDPCSPACVGRGGASVGGPARPAWTSSSWDMGSRPHTWGRAPAGLLRASWVVLATLLFGLGAAGGSSGGDFKGGGLRLSGLKGSRMRRGLSQGQLAKLVGVPRHYVQRIEQGRRGCNPWVAQKMAEELEVDLEELRAGSALEEGEKGTEGGVSARRGGPRSQSPGARRCTGLTSKCSSSGRSARLTRRWRRGSSRIGA
jgi:DNA-binding XRE family transcriptional regulator